MFLVRVDVSDESDQQKKNHTKHTIIVLSVTRGLMPSIRRPDTYMPHVVNARTRN